MDEIVKAFKYNFAGDIEIWEELEKKYSKEVIKRASEKTACGCATCTKNLLETGSPQYPIK